MCWALIAVPMTPVGAKRALLGHYNRCASSSSAPPFLGLVDDREYLDGPFNILDHDALVRIVGVVAERLEITQFLLELRFVSTDQIEQGFLTDR